MPECEDLHPKSVLLMLFKSMLYHTIPDQNNNYIVDEGLAAVSSKFVHRCAVHSRSTSGYKSSQGGFTILCYTVQYHTIQDIFGLFNELDAVRSYVLEVSTSLKRVYASFAMLTAHPLQRPPQHDARYALTTTQ